MWADFLSQYVVIPYFLILCRLGALVMVLPGLTYAAVNARFRLLLVLFIAAVLLPILSPKIPTVANTTMALTLAVFGEILVGLLLGLGVRFLITAWAAAGDLISYLIGFQAAQVFDPSAGSNTTAPSQFLTLVGLMVLLALNFHHTMLAAWVASYDIWVPSQFAWPIESMTFALFAAAGHALELGLRLAGPVALTGFLVYLGFGLLNKLVPNIQAFFLAVPVTLLAGIFVLGLALGGMIELFSAELITQGVMLEKLE